MQFIKKVKLLSGAACRRPRAGLEKGNSLRGALPKVVRRLRTALPSCSEKFFVCAMEDFAHEFAHARCRRMLHRNAGAAVLKANGAVWAFGSALRRGAQKKQVHTDGRCAPNLQTGTQGRVSRV